jgi:ribosomal protein S21
MVSFTRLFQDWLLVSQSFLTAICFGCPQGVCMVKVESRNNESSSQLLRRFRKAVARAQILSEVRKRRFFTSRSEESPDRKKESGSTPTTQNSKTPGRIKITIRKK